MQDANELMNGFILGNSMGGFGIVRAYGVFYRQIYEILYIKKVKWSKKIDIKGVFCRFLRNFATTN